MTRSFLLLFLILSRSAASAENPAPKTSDPIPQTAFPNTRVTSPLADGTPPPPGLPIPQQAFGIESSRTVQLPDRKLIIRRVVPPVGGFHTAEADTAEAVHPKPEADIPPETELLHISATVHQSRLTHVRGWTSAGQEFSAWTDIDFMDFSGVSSFIHGNRQYGLIMGVGSDESMPREAMFPARHGGFRFEKGETPGTSGIAAAFSALYAAEWKSLAAARRSREAAGKKAAAQPPVPPRDIVLSFWDKPSRPLTDAEKARRDSLEEGAR
jgi:hypothetical protein